MGWSQVGGRMGWSGGDGWFFAPFVLDAVTCPPKSFSTGSGNQPTRIWGVLLPSCCIFLVQSIANFRCWAKASVSSMSTTVNPVSAR